MLTDRSRIGVALCSTLAIAAALASAPARAQSFVGTGVTTSGSADITTAPATTTVTVNTPQAVIDWTATATPTPDGRVIFQPANTTAIFQNNPETTATFALLNRITPSAAGAPIQFDGTVISRLQQLSGATSPGGTVFFYSPNGIIIGSTAVFNVGNLGLTTSPVAVDANGNWLGPNNSVSFGAANTNTSVIINQGAQINASASSSFIGVVAPKVIHNGAINVNGSAALVAADAANITFNFDGLFDIEVTSGSSESSSGIALSTSFGGSITGPAGNGLGNSHRVYLVAVPKNTAISMAITQGTTLGFDVAGAADVDGNAVILSGGYDIVDGEIGPRSAGAGTGTISINMGGSTVTSDFTAASTHNVGAVSFAGETMSFASNVDIRGLNDAELSADGAGAQTTVAGNATVSASREGQFTGATAGMARLVARNSGVVTIGGDATVRAVNTPTGPTGTFLDGQSRNGGNVRLAANDLGRITIAGNVLLDASGFGAGRSSTGAKGNGAGGGVLLQAFNGGMIDIDGGVTGLAEGRSNSSGFIGTTGGNGTGGLVQVLVNGGNSTLDIAGFVDLSARGFGSLGGRIGAEGGPGGIGTGGTVTLNGNGGTGNVLNIGGDLTAFADGEGGDGFDTAAGNGIGGAVRFGAGSGTTVTVTGFVAGEASGYGGDTINNGSNGVFAGGNGQGGQTQVTIFGAGGSFTGNSGLRLFSFGGGGEGLSGGSFAVTSNGGNGTGGNAQVFLNQGSITFDGTVGLDATGFGGSGVNGGFGQGGNASLSLNGPGILTVTADGVEESISITTDGFGGAAAVAGGTSGNGRGGNAQIVATGGGDVILAGQTTLSSTGQSFDFGIDGTDGGDGTGGNASISQNTGGSVDITGGVTIDVTGFAASNYGGGDRIAGTGRGGDGRIAVNDAGGIRIDGNVDISAGGFGGDGAAVTGQSSGGAGFGGLANIGAINGANTVTGQAQLFANGQGGDASLDGAGGAGTGGQALIGTVAGTTAASISIGGQGGFSSANAGGEGGAAAGSGAGGAGTGGNAQVFGSSGTLTIADQFSLGADGVGGGSVNGTGGLGTGGRALANANTGGTVRFTDTTAPHVIFSASGVGGTAIGSGDGGDAIAGPAQVGVNGGNAIFSSGLTLIADMVGGDGVNGGDARSVNSTFAEGGLFAANGTISVAGATTIESLAFGGEGSNGGTGGSATSGQILILAESSAAGGSRIELADLSATSIAFGGRGGDGIASTSGAGGVGGAGGSALVGSSIQAFGTASNGVLVVNGTTSFDASAFGGAGGTGGAGGSGFAGGAGGAGGVGQGSGANFGTRSGVDTLMINNGSATFGDVTSSGTGAGGNGGDGGAGTTQGVGGAGGAGFGGFATLQSRGTPVVIGNATLSATGLGGDGGAGSTMGAGGNGYAGNIFILATQRFQRTERGSLVAGDINAFTSGIGGAGSTLGLGYFSDSAQIMVQQADAQIANLSLSTSGDTRPDYTVEAFGFDPVTGQQVLQTFTVTAQPTDLFVIDGTINVAGALSIDTPGDLRLTLERSTANVADLVLSAGNFVLPATAPTTPGTFNVTNSLGLFSNDDIVTYANFTTPFGVSFSTIGDFRTGDFAVTGGGFFAESQTGSVTVGAVGADGAIDLVAATDVAAGNLTARGATIDIAAGGAVTAGALVGGDTIAIDAEGAINVASASAGLVNASTATDAEFNIGLRSNTSITAGALSARASIGLASPGAVTVGDLSAGQAVLALAGAGLTTGGITTATSGRVYLADISMEALGGEIAGSFDPSPIFAAEPVPMAGPITIGGPVSTGIFQAATNQAFTSGAITAASSLEIDAGQITTGALSAVEDIGLSSAASLTLGAITTSGGLFVDTGGSLTTGDVQAREIELEAVQGITTGTLSASRLIDVDAGGAVLTGAITAGQSVSLDAGTTLTAGNITAGNDPITQFSIGLVGGENISVGNLTGSSTIGILSQTGGITAGNVTAGRSLLALARGAVNLGGVTTGGTASDFLYIANSSMASLGGPLDDTFNPAPIFAATPVATTGPITIAGPVSTGNLIAATTGALSIGGSGSVSTISVPGEVELFGGALTVGNITAGTDIALTSTGALASGNLTAGDAILVSAGGPVGLGNLSAGLVNPSTAAGATRGVGVRSTSGNVTIGTISASRDIGVVASGGSLTTGNIASDRNVLLLARDSATTGSIAVGTAGQILVAGSLMAGQAGALDNINPAVFTATPIALTGAITLGGPVTGGTLTAAATGNFTAANLTLGQRITLARAATAQVNGAWVAPTINLASQRLTFGTPSNAGIGAAGTTQSVTLRALASGQPAVLGGTTQGSGYTLTQSDFARVRASNLTVQVDSTGMSGTAPDVEIRDLSLTGSAGSGMSAVTITTPGRARVVGDLVLAQAGAQDTLTVNAARRLEIVLPEGSISITGANGALAGTLTLSSDNLVAGTLTLLEQIMADPEAAGLADALKTPASTTSNLEGYIRADGVRLLSNANILLQNSGTARDFAGVTVGGGNLIIGRLTPSAGPGTGTTAGFSFVGMLMGPNEVLLFEFRVDAASAVTLRTYSYAGGVNAAGQTIPSGGFDPILALFDSAGQLIGQNDDGGSNVPADPTTGARFDTFLTSQLMPGNYTVSVSVFPNFANGPNLSNGFAGDVSSFGNRTANFAFDVLGASSAVGPGSQNGPLNVIGFGRQIGANGQPVTGNTFFGGINFSNGPESTIQFTERSQFNSCLVSGGCPAPSFTEDPVASISSEIELVGQDTLEEEPFEDAAEEEDEAEADEASSPIAPPAPLIDTRPLNPAVDVVEPVSGAGNPALIGSAVNETTAQGETP